MVGNEFRIQILCNKLRSSGDVLRSMNHKNLLRVVMVGIDKWFHVFRVILVLMSISSVCSRSRVFVSPTPLLESWCAGSDGSRHLKTVTERVLNLRKNTHIYNALCHSVLFVIGYRRGTWERCLHFDTAPRMP